MLNVTPEAGEALRKILAASNEEVKTVRIYLEEEGCGGPSLGLALDVKNQADHVFEVEGITFLMAPALYDEVKPVSLDFVTGPCGSGFSLTSSLPSSCGSGCNCS
jgi:iron-sulfur cluster assembly accessory protein